MLKEYLKDIEMSETNILRKNIASIITMSTELIKILLTFIFMNSIDTLYRKIIFIYAIIATIFAIYIFLNDEYTTVKKYFILDFSSLVFLLSNIVSGILIESILFKADKKIIKSLTKTNKIKRLPILFSHSKIVYAYIFINIIILYELPHYSTLLFCIFNFISLAIFFVEDIKQSIISFKNNIKQYLSYIFTHYAYMIILSSILFMIVSILVGSSSTNEQLINQESKIYLLIYGCIYAPIVEELLFRGCLRKIIKNDVLFIFISGISFGAWHVVGYDQSLIQYLYIVPYSIMGICLSYVYCKTNNLTTNIGIHFLNNLVATIF